MSDLELLDADDSAVGELVIDAISDGISIISLSENDELDELEFTELIQQFERIEKLHTDAIASCKSIERQLKDNDIIYVNYMGKRYTFDEMLDELHETAVYNLQTGNTFGSLLLSALEGAVFE